MEKVLTIDDSKTMRWVIRGVAETLGFEAYEASNGQEGLALLGDHFEEIALILLDINMPVMNGIETLEAIRKDERFNAIPVIMVTTEAEKQNVILTIRMGANNYVVKPFVSEELSTRMMETLQEGTGC